MTQDADLDELQQFEMLSVVDQITSNFLVTNERRKIIGEWKVWKCHHLQTHAVPSLLDLPRHG